MLVSYAHELSFGEMVTFLERALGEKFDKKVLVKMNNIFEDSKGRVIDFTLLTPSSTSSSTARFSNYECVMVSDDPNIGKINFKKEWAKYVCEVLSNRKVINHLNSVTVYQYRSDYNDFWSKVRKDKIAKADEEYEQNILR
jgi:hypothetical protein